VKFLFEVLVHAGVQQGVVDGGAHGYDVGDKEE